MKLKNKRIAILAENKYEDLELHYPRLRMIEEGAQVDVIGMPGNETYTSKHGYPAVLTKAVDSVHPDNYDAVIIPGGYAPDYIRRHQAMLDLVKAVYDAGKLVAFICHAGWVPISAGIIRGHKVTSVTAIKDDLINAGGEWVDEEVVVDKNLISSQGVEDLPAFCREIIKTLS